MGACSAELACLGVPISRHDPCKIGASAAVVPESKPWTRAGVETWLHAKLLPRRRFVDRSAIATSCQLSSFFSFLFQLSSRHRSFEVLFLSIACDIGSSSDLTPRTDFAPLSPLANDRASSQIDYQIWRPILAFKTVSNLLFDNCAIEPGTFNVEASTYFGPCGLSQYLLHNSVHVSSSFYTCCARLANKTQ